MNGDPELRKDIDAVMVIEYPSQFAAAWEQLITMGGHRLQIIDRDKTYNCHAHGLQIERMPEFQRLFVERGCRVLAKSDFMAKLIEHGEVRIVEGQSYGPENIVIYFKDGKPTHTSRGHCSSGSSSRASRSS